MTLTEVRFTLGRMDKVLQKAIKVAGGYSALAKAIGVKRQAVHQWTRVPVMKVLKVELVTGISRYDLRPDVYPRDQ